MNRSALLAFALDAMAIAAVAILGLAHVVPPEAVIGFFCTVWAAGRGRGGPPEPPARPELGRRSTVGTALRSTLIARAALGLEASARALLLPLRRSALPA